MSHEQCRLHKSKVGEGKDEAMAQLVKLSAADAGDASKAEHLAGAAASVLPAQSAMAQPAIKYQKRKWRRGLPLRTQRFLRLKLALIRPLKVAPILLHRHLLMLLVQ